MNGPKKIRQKKSVFLLLLFLILNSPVSAIKIQWEASEVADLAGYRVYVGNETEQYCDTLDVGNVLSYDLNWMSMICGNTYYFSVTAYDDWGNESGFSPEISYTEEESETTTDVEGHKSGHGPHEFGLAQNFPNPFNPSTKIQFSVEKTGNVSLAIYNMRGERVKTLVDNNTMYAGIAHTVEWDGRNEFGNQVASGVYVYRLQQGNQMKTKRMILAR